MCAANGGDRAAHSHTPKAFIQAPHPLCAGTRGQDQSEMMNRRDCDSTECVVTVTKTQTMSKVSGRQ